MSSNLDEIIKKGRANAKPDKEYKDRECYYFDTLVEASGLTPTPEALAEFAVRADWHTNDNQGFWFQKGV